QPASSTTKSSRRRRSRSSASEALPASGPCDSGGEQGLLGFVLFVCQSAALVERCEALQALDPVVGRSPPGPSPPPVEVVVADLVREVPDGLSSQDLEPDKGEDDQNHDGQEAPWRPDRPPGKEEQKDDRESRVHDERVVAEGRRQPSAAG